MTPEYILRKGINEAPHCSELPAERRLQHLEDLGWAPAYAEPGYLKPKKAILFFNWNEVGRRTFDLLEQYGFECEWEDEWTQCGGCGKALRTSPDSYSWQPSYFEIDGELTCIECTDIEAYLETLEDNPRRAVNDHIDPADYGYVKLEGDFENSFHPGQNDNPREIFKRLQAAGHKRLLFNISSVGQFDIRFEQEDGGRLMSTRSVIARATGEGKFEGRYVHCDGMPTSMGAWFWESLHGHFHNDLSAMLAYLIDAPHAVAGWSGLVGKDLTLRPGYSWQRATADGAKYEVYSKRPDYRRPQAFALRPEDPYLFTEKDLENGTDIEWIYAFDEEQRKVFVRDVSAKEDAAVIDLDGEQPNWVPIECGENLERCKHYAWKHNLTPETCNLSTQTWLGNRPLEFRDAIAFLIDGKRHKATGSGGNSEYLRKFGSKNYPSNTWVSTVIAANGRRLEVPVAAITPKGYAPLPGVAWIFPPTKSNPNETEVRESSVTRG